MPTESHNLAQRSIPIKEHRHHHHRTEIVKVLVEHKAEHLSTLVTAANRPPPDSDSSLIRLRQLSKNGQLNVTKVHLVLQESSRHYELVVTDGTTGETCERMRLEDISKPIYKESNDPKDAFNNLLMFNVDAHLQSREGPTQNEMHIFQCLHVPAHVVVEELMNPESLRISPEKEDTVHISDSPVVHQASLMRLSDSSDEEELPPKEPVASMQKQNSFNDLGYSQQQLTEKALIDGEILLLNMCFDDIESYVGHITKLQRARTLNAKQEADDNISVAAANGKKKKRFIFKKRQASKAKEPEIPRITSNTSISSEIEIPISDEELIDLFEKIKFSIILLSRLQGYVTEPNPPLLTHRLFTMLKQPIDFIRDMETGKPELAINVISPLFPEAAIRLIQDSLIEPEISMWHELGEGWNLAKEKWNKKVPTYVPVFKCGFKPNPEQYSPTLFGMPEHGFVNQIEKSNSAIEFRTTEDYYQHLMRSGEKIARVKHDFMAESEQELSLKIGEYVAVIDDSRNWHRLRNFKGAEGYAPYTVLDFI